MDAAPHIEPCAACDAELVAGAKFCHACGASVGVATVPYAKPAGPQGREWRTRAAFLGLPLVHVVQGVRDPATGRKKIAKGWIASGEIAVGFIAWGGISCGVIAGGGIAVGGLTFGGIAVGLISIGGIAAGVAASGGVAFGILFSNGGLAAGGGAVYGGLRFKWW
jgi:hypothetical protein